MKTILCGGRNYRFTDADKRALDRIRSAITVVVSGGATGADRCGELWAQSHGITVCVCPAQWHLYGVSAGPIRNREMAEYAQACIVFPGGAGTANMFATAKAKGLLVLDWRGDSRDAGELDLF